MDDAKTHRDPTWPVAGFAPGGYVRKCIACGGHFQGMGKRATQCFPCAVESLKGENARLRETAKLFFDLCAASGAAT